MYIYPDVINGVRSACINHLNDSALFTLSDLQKAVSFAEQLITSINENDIKYYLTDAESKLELIRFTVSQSEQTTQSQKVALNILEWFDEREEKFNHRRQ